MTQKKVSTSEQVFWVHKDNPDTKLTEEQVWDMLLSSEFQAQNFRQYDDRSVTFKQVHGITQFTPRSNGSM